MTQSGEELCANQKTLILIVLLPLLIPLYLFYFQNDTYLMNGPLVRNALGLASGFYFAIVVGHCLIKMTSDAMWLAAAGYTEDPEPHFDTSAIIGWLERALYVLFLLLHKPEAIGLWLTLKAAGRIWTKERLENDPLPREIYQIFLISNALSIGYAIVGWVIVVWLLRENPGDKIGSIISLLFIVIIGNHYIVHKVKSEGAKNWSKKGIALNARGRTTKAEEAFANARKLGYNG
jgi:hypothetical protein